MAIIPDVNDLNIQLNEPRIEQKPRGYLGLSQIGSECHRYLQYHHYWAFKSEISARIERIFRTGHDAEEFMIEDLKKVGYFVKDRQVSIVGSAGYWKGHIDGTVYHKGEKILIEFKTHNDKSFKDVVKKRVIKSKPVHYAQVQSYMGYLELDQCMYMAYNKNTSEYYVEFINFDEDFFKESKRKEVEIIISDRLLPRIGNGRANWHTCITCNARKVCYKATPVTITCRSCKHVDIIGNGNWRCDLNNKALDESDQEKACNRYILSEMFDVN